MKSKNIIIRATLFLCFTAAWAQQVPISGETYSSSDPETCCSVTGQSAGQIELDDFSIQYTCGAYANPSKKCVPAAADSRQCASPCAADPSCKAASWTLANTKVRCYFALGDSYSIQTNKNWILLEEPSGAVTEPELEPGPGSEQEPEPTTPPEEWSEELEKCSEELDQCSDQNQKCDAGCKKCTDDHKMLEAKEKECQKKKNELQLIVTSLNAPCRSGSHKIGEPLRIIFTESGLREMGSLLKHVCGVAVKIPSVSLEYGTLKNVTAGYTLKFFH
ncbi:hypothetical protein N7507_002663 [Penicillium longicatenatum]|nr:hypothetical protein N7507_002663 [Penicillium longicatenatum]